MMGLVDFELSNQAKKIILVMRRDGKQIQVKM